MKLKKNRKGIPEVRAHWRWQVRGRDEHLHSMLSFISSTIGWPITQVSIIISRDERRNIYSAYFRWPLKGVWILNWSLTSSWPTWPQLTIRSKFRVQNIVPADSEIVKTCSLRIDDNSLIKIRELFSSGKAHPNDTTPDNLTLMRVCYVIYSNYQNRQADASLVCNTRWKSRVD